MIGVVRCVLRKCVGYQKNQWILLFNVNEHVNGENINDSFVVMQQKVEEINKLKKSLDYVLNSRPDVQIIHGQLANLNREILFSTQDKELKEDYLTKQLCI